jgi:hypothetical protein
MPECQAICRENRAVGSFTHQLNAPAYRSGANLATAAAETIAATKQQAAGGAAVQMQASPTKGDTIHTLCTSNGSPYLNFQNRIM